MTNENVVNIHGKQYLTVAGRVQIAHEEAKKLSITTELLPVTGQVVVKATVTTDKGTFTGISAANPSKTIEKQSPFEVAETSAVGRALGFAGFGVVEGIATADEMKKAETPDPTDAWKSINDVPDMKPKDPKWCEVHEVLMKVRTRKDGSQWYDHRQQLPDESWRVCAGQGWKDQPKRAV